LEKQRQMEMEREEERRKAMEQREVLDYISVIHTSKFQTTN